MPLAALDCKRQPVLPPLACPPGLCLAPLFARHHTQMQLRSPPLRPSPYQPLPCCARLALYLYAVHFHCLGLTTLHQPHCRQARGRPRLHHPRQSMTPLPCRQPHYAARSCRQRCLAGWRPRLACMPHMLQRSCLCQQRSSAASLLYMLWMAPRRQPLAGRAQHPHSHAQHLH